MGGHLVVQDWSWYVQTLAYGAFYGVPVLLMLSLVERMDWSGGESS